MQKYSLQNTERKLGTLAAECKHPAVNVNSLSITNPHTNTRAGQIPVLTEEAVIAGTSLG